jgi:cation diffusion facilitator family transporter
MATGGSKIAIYGAIGANFLISVMKFVAASFTGSAAMISEGIHSLIDTFNGVLLLVGIKRSQKEPNEKHPFGYGKEVYFWSLVVAVLIFGLGGGLALYEGINHIMHPTDTGDVPVVWNFSVLAGAIAFREFRKANPTGFVSAIRKSKDAATFAVMVEDTAALVGLVIALIGVSLGHYTGNHMYDGAASIGIGLLLCTVAIFLIYETKGLLVGEGAHADEVFFIQQAVREESVIESFGEIRSMHFGPHDVLLAFNVDFQDHISAAEVEQTIARLKSKIKEQFPKFGKIYIGAIEED